MQCLQLCFANEITHTHKLRVEGKSCKNSLRLEREKHKFQSDPFDVYLFAPTPSHGSLGYLGNISVTSCFVFLLTGCTSNHCAHEENCDRLSEKAIEKIEEN
jgi:hypothetical protein